MSYKHGIEVIENKTSFPTPLTTRYGVQVVCGTSPVNLAEDPYAMVNVPVRVDSFESAVKLLGYSDVWEKYTLCESMYASFKLFQVSPVIFINVLDASKHSKNVDESGYIVKNHQVNLKTDGVLKDSVKISTMIEETIRPLTENSDFVMDFDEAWRSNHNTAAWWYCI